MSQDHNNITKTLSIIKPDAIRKNFIGQIIARLEANGLKVVASKMLHLTKKQAEKFYAIHADKPFFNDLVNFMSSDPVIVQVLEGYNAVEQNRKIMGATNPELADQGTIRKDFAESIDHNAVHGSDSIENAKLEIAFFFAESEIYGKC